MPGNPRGVGLESGTPGLSGSQVGTTSDGNPIIAWPASVSINEVLDPIDGAPSDNPDWETPSGGDGSGVADGGGSASPGNGGDSWYSSGAGSLINGDTGLIQVGDEACMWVKSETGNPVGPWFGVQDSDNLYYCYLTPARPTGMADSWEDADISEYSGDTASFSVGTTNVTDGSYALEGNSGGSFVGISSSSGLDRYPQQGDTFRVDTQMSGGRSESFFACQSETAHPEGYKVLVEASGDQFRLFKIANGSGTELASSSVSISTGTQYTVEVDWGDGGGLTCRLLDSSGAEVTSISATDTTYSSGGVGFGVNTGGSSATGWFDALEITSTSGSLSIGKYENGSATEFDKTGYSFSVDTWYLLKLRWYNNGDIEASAHEDHDLSALATVAGNDSTYTSGGAGIEFSEAGQNFDMLSKCGGLGLVDTFEDGDIAEYSGDTGSFSLETTTVFEGGYALAGTSSGSSVAIISQPGDGLDNVPQEGDSWTHRVRKSKGSSGIAMGLFACQSYDYAGDYYRTRIDAANDNFAIEKRVGGSTSSLASVSQTISADIWYEIETTWLDDGTIEAVLYDEGGTQLASLAATDTDLSGGGVGWAVYNGGGETAYWDYARIV